ncbi:hypothetical protein BGZ72_003061 [Mortierella alpina]|nr:hypothetical protein BGZ72_003061 [Mortierella alpina]
MKFNHPFTVLGLSLASVLSIFSSHLTLVHARPLNISPTLTTSPPILPYGITPSQHSTTPSASRAHTKHTKAAEAPAKQGFKKRQKSSPKNPSTGIPRKNSNPSTLAEFSISPPTTPTPASTSPAVPTATELPLLLLPDSNSVWQAGSVQQVQWSKKYTKQFPKDTTIDIVLTDAKTNKKIHSLKRYVPYRKGAAQVWVPSKLPDGVSYVLVLELFHGRGPKPIAFNSTILGSNLSSKSSPSPTATAKESERSSSSSGSASSSTESKSVKAPPSIVRRSEINIARRRRRDARNSLSLTPSTPSIHASLEANDIGYFHEDKGVQLLDLRIPGVIQPIEIEHNFGVHKHVFSQTPYMLRWIVPARVMELLNYSEKRLKLMADKTIDLSQYRAFEENRAIYLAKMLVELVDDHALETISVLSRNVPAETRFLITQIHERVPQAYYRLRIQMVVVEVQGGGDVAQQERLVQDSASSKVRPSHGDYMEGWDFPTGCKIIDRYETITRRFQISTGAL